MRFIGNGRRRRKWQTALVGIGAAFAVGLGGCAGGLSLRPTERMPQASGTVKVTKDAQANVRLAIEVRHLPRPNEMDPHLTTFVVWSIAEGGKRVRNMGHIHIDSNRRGSVDVVSPLQRFDILITGEADEAADTPSEFAVLKGSIGS